MGTAAGPEEKQEFTFGEDDLRDLFAFVFVIGADGTKAAIFKKHYPISLIRRDSFFGLVQADHRFVRLDADIVKINDTFDFLRIADETFVFNVKLLEKLSGFDGILRREAAARIDLIRAANIIENIELLEELASDQRAAKKLLRAKRSSQVLALAFAQIRTFILGHPKLKNRIRFNQANNQIKFHTRTSQHLFLKLLDDDFLKSDLTGSLYDSENKQDLSPDEEGDGDA